MTPFSGPRYPENESKCKEGESPCCLCGKPVLMSNDPPMAEVHDGGSFVLASDPEPDQSDPGYMGWFPVGTSCVRKLRKAGVKIYPET